MKLKITITMDSAAFEDPAEAERILADIGKRIEAGETAGFARDSNGNTVGSWGIEE